MDSAETRGRIHKDMLWLSGMTVMLYMLPAVALNGVSADSVEYLMAGKNIWDGRGHMLEVVGYVLPDAPAGAVTTNLHPIGFTILAGFLFAKTGSIHPVQALNVFLAAANVVIVYRMTLLLSHRRVAMLAALLVAWLPTMAHHAYQVMAEELSLCLALLALWTIVAEPRALSGWIIGGGMIGLAIMTRSANAALGAGLVLAGVLWRDEALHRRALYIGGLAGGATGVWLTLSLLRPEESGLVFKSYWGIFFRVLDFHDLLVVDEPGRMAVTPYQLLRDRFPDVLERVLSNGGRYLTLLVSSHWFSVMSIGVPAALAVALFKNDFRWMVLAIGGALNLLLASATWYWFDPRYLLVTYVLWLPLCLCVLEDWRKRLSPFVASLDRRVWWIAAGVTILILAHPRVMLVGRLNAAAVESLATGGDAERLARAQWSALATWLRREPPENVVVAAKDPSEVHWRTRVPTLILPDAGNGELLRAFLVRHRARYVLLNRPPEDLPGRERRVYAEVFAPEMEGPAFQAGQLRLYAVPAKRVEP